MKADSAQPSQNKVMGWGSDVVAEMLRRLGIKYVCVNPGSSFRGLHDSLVNYLGNDDSKLMLALHEQSVVAIAHGYAKVTGEPMAVVVHSNVGLMCGLMSIFNAWCDRVPILMLGATGAVDSAVRRSWIDWSHTFRDQGALVRHYVKWDEQPASPQAAVDSMLRAYQAACTAPRGPSYVILDRRLQEDALTKDIVIPDVARYAPPLPGAPPEAAVSQAGAWLHAAKNPAIMLGRVSTKSADWDARIRVAELLNARVITDMRSGASFPTAHPLHGGPHDLFLSPNDKNILAKSDVVLSLDWPDLQDCMIQARGASLGGVKIIQVSVDAQIQNSYNGDHQRLPAVDLNIAVPPDAILAPLIAKLEGEHRREAKPPPKLTAPTAPKPELTDQLPTLTDIGRAFAYLRNGRKLTLTRVPLNWPAGAYQLYEPLDYLGYDGGGGVGSGPGMAVGAALALQDRDSDRIAVGIMGDGEFVGSASALWTAAHYRIPVLIVVGNNRSYFTDEIQQELVAKERKRPPENRWIGQRIDDPPVDIAGLARDYGVAAEGPIEKASDLLAALERGIKAVESGEPYLVDVLIDPTRGAAFDWLSGA
jgi:thiamine pyrophosphate-dependent acetolactate synthase large subunit-like protein